jgi:hypothetical protein
MRTADLLAIDPHGHLGVNDEGHLEATTDVEDFYNEIDRNCFGVEDAEDTVSFSDMSAALSLIVGWACTCKDIRQVAGKILALGVMLDPVNMPYGRTDLTAIAREVGCTKQAVSKWLLHLRDQSGVALTIGKKASVRETCKQAQEAAMRAGCHASHRRAANRAIKQAKQAVGDLIGSAQ